jgi:hypothetical protein
MLRLVGPFFQVSAPTFPTLRLHINGESQEERIMKTGKKSKTEKHVSDVEAGLMQPAEQATTEVSVSDPGPAAVEMPTTPEMQTDKAPKVKDSGPTQREAVYQEVLRVMQDEQIPYDPALPVKPLLNEVQLKRVQAGVVAGFLAGKVPMKQTESNQKKLGDVKLLELYVIGLTNNWLKRDRRLNGKGDPKA